MINLLPPNSKETILYARRNTLLLRWLTAICIGLVGVAVVILAGQLYLDQTSQSFAAEVERTEEQLKLQKITETQKRVNDISASLKLMVQVLSRQVLFSELIMQIGAVTPPETALTNLTISKLEGGIDLQFRASHYHAATQIQVNLEDPSNRIFEKADIVSINCSGSNTSNTTTSTNTEIRYPCTVTIRALFAKDNPFLLISKGREGTAQ